MEPVIFLLIYIAIGILIFIYLNNVYRNFLTKRYNEEDIDRIMINGNDRYMGVYFRFYSSLIAWPIILCFFALKTIAELINNIQFNRKK